MSDANKTPPAPVVEGAEVISLASLREKKKVTATEGVNLEEVNKENYTKKQEAARRRRADVNARLRRDLKNGGGGQRW
jgi:hypothetical protein